MAVRAVRRLAGTVRPGRNDNCAVGAMIARVQDSCARPCRAEIEVKTGHALFHDRDADLETACSRPDTPGCLAWASGWVRPGRALTGLRRQGQSTADDRHGHYCGPGDHPRLAGPLLLRPLQLKGSHCSVPAMTRLTIAVSAYETAHRFSSAHALWDNVLPSRLRKNGFSHFDVVG